MSFEDKYAAKVFPDRVRVLGVDLAPVTIGHGLLLHRIGSPLVTGGELGNGDLLLGLYVLSRGCREAASDLQTGRAAGVIRKWGRKLGGAFGWRRAGIEALAGGAKAALVEYVERSWEAPELWEEEAGEGKALSAPMLQVLKVRVMSCLHQSEEGALNMGIGVARWDLACWGEDQGHCEWVSEEETEAIDTALRLERN
jgi:hypothetical protein